MHSPPRDRKSLAKSLTRKSLAKGEDDKESIADSNQGDGFAAPYVGSDEKDEGMRKDEIAQPLAAGATTSAQEGQ